MRRYAEGGFTSVIHGKVWHEETQATASQAVRYGGHYLVVFNGDEADVVCRVHPRGRRPRRPSSSGSRGRLPGVRSRPRSAAHRPRQPDDDADVASRWRSASMLQGRDARPLRRGRHSAAHFQAFDTICSATQDRQDAVVDPARGAARGPDGGDRRLQQQQHLQSRAHLRRRRPTFHIASPDCLESSAAIRHRPVASAVRSDRTLAALGAGGHRPDVGRLNAGQPRGRPRRPADRADRLTAPGLLAARSGVLDAKMPGAAKYNRAAVVFPSSSSFIRGLRMKPFGRDG